MPGIINIGNKYSVKIRFTEDKDLPNKLYNTKVFEATIKHDFDFGIEYLKHNERPSWNTEKATLHYLTCNRCKWRFVWMRRRKYCSDKCRWNK